MEAMYKVVITVNEYKEVRRRWMEGESQRSIAKTLGISRNTVKKYCAGDTVPWERKAYSPFFYFLASFQL